MSCIGICIRYKALRPNVNNGSRYIVGQKRCQICDIFLNYDGLQCPCCHYRLRLKPRLGAHREKYFEMMNKK